MADTKAPKGADKGILVTPTSDLMAAKAAKQQARFDELTKEAEAKKK